MKQFRSDAVAQAFARLFAGSIGQPEHKRARFDYDYDDEGVDSDGYCTCCPESCGASRPSSTLPRRYFQDASESSEAEIETESEPESDGEVPQRIPFVPEQTIHLSASVLGFVLYRCMTESPLNPAFKAKNFADLSAMLLFLSKYGNISMNFRSIVMSALSGWIRTNSCTLDLQKSMSKRKDFISQLELNSSRARVSIRITAAQLLKFATVPKQLQTLAKILNPEAVTSVSLVYSVTKNIKVPTLPPNSLFPFPNLESITLWSAANVAPVFKVLEVFSLPKLMSLTIRVSDKFHVAFPNAIAHITELNVVATHNRSRVDLSNLIGLKTLIVDCFNKSLQLSGLELLYNLENLQLNGYLHELSLHPNAKLLNLKFEDIPNSTIAGNNLTELQHLHLVHSGNRVCESIAIMTKLQSIIIDCRRTKPFSRDLTPYFRRFELPFLPQLQHFELYRAVVDCINFVNLPLITTMIIGAMNVPIPKQFINIHHANFLTNFGFSPNSQQSPMDPSVVLTPESVCNLTELFTTTVMQIHDVDCLPNMRKLTLGEGILRGYNGFYSVEFSKLCELTLKKQVFIPSKFDWSLFPRLKTLNLLGCDFPKQSLYVNTCSVEQLTIKLGFQCRSLKFLKSFPNVRRLFFHNSFFSVDIASLKYCPYLTYLEISDWGFINRYQLEWIVESLKSLRFLYLDYGSSCPNLEIQQTVFNMIENKRSKVIVQSSKIRERHSLWAREE
ncbi:hypothetical protein RCL1_003970 [Eukaryota sp. TZLM3-RCL]